MEIVGLVMGDGLDRIVAVRRGRWSGSPRAARPPSLALETVALALLGSAV